MLYYVCKTSDRLAKQVSSDTISMIRRASKHHLMDCYFCLSNIVGISAKSKHVVQYPYLPSAIRPVLHSEDLPAPRPKIDGM
jgi:hypothetical protein